MQGAEILTKFTADDTQTNKAIDSLGENLQKLEKIGKVAFVGLATAVDVFTVKTLKAGIAYNAEMETMNVRLETLTGSAEEADKVMDQIRKDAVSTPFDVASLTQAESLLISTGLSADESRDAILALGNAVSATGGGNAELQRMAVNLQQIKNVGKASSLDIKQFAYAGIDVYGLLADSMGITRAEATELDITYDMLVDALQGASKEGGKFYGAMDKQSKTLAGASSNLQESLAVLKGELAEGVFNALKDVIPKLTELFDWLGKNKELVLAIVIPILTFINTIMGMLMISKITTTIIALYVAMRAHPFTVIVAAIAALVAGFMYLWKNCESFRNFFITLWEALKQTVDTTVGGIKDAFNDLISGLTWLWDKIQGIKNNIANTFTNLGEGIKNVFEGVRNGIVNAFSGIGNLIKAPINAIIDAINKVINKINSMTVPDWVPGIGGSHTNFPTIPKLATGTNYVPNDMLAEIHKGEMIVPKKFNPYANGTNFNSIVSSGTGNNIIVNIENNMEMDSLGQLVNNVKTFSGGAKNDYNYGMGR